MQRTVSLIPRGRGGQVIYTEGLRSITGSLRQGEDDRLEVSLGSEQDWRASHGWALERRASILRFVAEELVRQQSNSSAAEIDEVAGEVLLRPHDAAEAPAAGRNGWIGTARGKYGLLGLLAVLAFGTGVLLKSQWSPAPVPAAAQPATPAADPSALAAGAPPSPWRIGEGQVAPWAPAGTAVDSTWSGMEVQFQASRLLAPAPLGCDPARYEWLILPAESLFEGNLPIPANIAASRLGLQERVASLRVSCANAGFDFHLGPGGILLLGLDNVVWTLHPGATDDRPAAAVQSLLIEHLLNDMGFTPFGVERKSSYLTDDLRARLAAWFAVARAREEAPRINGDPFTDSQEYPDRFAIGAVEDTVEGSTVTVRFPRGAVEHRVHYVMRREGDRWRVDDLRYADGSSLRALLAAG